MPAVRNHLDRVAGHQRALAVGKPRAMKHRSPGEMAAAADHRRRADRERLAGPGPYRAAGALHPDGVVLMDQDRRAAEGRAPFEHRGIVVRVRDRDRGNPAQLLDLGDDLVVDQAQAVPKDVAVLVLDQECPLADGEVRLDGQAAEPLLLLLPDDVMALRQRLQRRPFLPALRHPLALVLADRATGGRPGLSGYWVPQVAHMKRGMDYILNRPRQTSFDRCTAHVASRPAEPAG